MMPLHLLIFNRWYISKLCNTLSQQKLIIAVSRERSKTHFDVGISVQLFVGDIRSILFNIDQRFSKSFYSFVKIESNLMLRCKDGNVNTLNEILMLQNCSLFILLLFI